MGDSILDAQAGIGVCHRYRRLRRVVYYLLVGTGYVEGAPDGGANTRKRAVRLEAKAARIGNERVARNAGGLVVCLAKPSIDYQYLPVRPHRGVPVDLVYRRVSVPYVNAWSHQAKLG